MVLAPTDSHRFTSTTLAGYGPGSEASWRVCQRGTGRRGAGHRPRYRGGRAGAALRCRHQLIAMAAGHGRTAGCEWCSTWTSNPTEAPGARRHAACQILSKPAVGESPFLRARYNSAPSAALYDLGFLDHERGTGPVTSDRGLARPARPRSYLWLLGTEGPAAWARCTGLDETVIRP
jgi:hypothetical protein